MPKLVVDSTPEKGRYWGERHYNVVAIDVLRATSTIVVALFQHAKEIIPCAEVDEAIAFRKNPNTILAGERKGEIIPGFDYTNSPLDMSRVNLDGKSLVLTTSDGTRLITNASRAERVLISSTLNYEIIAQAILGIGGDWALIGAGSGGDFRPEDKVGCALVGKTLIDNGSFELSEDDKEFILTQSTNWQKRILESLSSEKLRKIGREADIEFVIDGVNIYPVIAQVLLSDRLIKVVSK